MDITKYRKAGIAFLVVTISAGPTTFGMPPIVQSIFDSDLEGWTGDSLGFGTDDPPISYGAWTPIFQPTGGNPGGYARFDEAISGVSGGDCYMAPPPFLGNKSQYFGGVFQFDIFVMDPLDRGVWFRGASMTMRAPTYPLGTTWTPVSLPLAESGWTQRATGEQVSHEEFIQVLSSLQQIYIAADSTGAVDFGGLDNVRMIPMGACCLTDGSCQFLTEVQCTALNGDEWTPAVDCDDSNSDGVPDVCVPDCITPTITRQPASQTVCERNLVTVSIEAAATPVPTYQWRKDGISIAGATGSALTIDSAIPNDSGTYDAEVSNPCNSIISDAATIIVWPSATGDVNGNGLVDGLDIGGFVEVFAESPNGPAALDFCAADLNGDGRVTYEDVEPFVRILVVGP